MNLTANSMRDALTCLDNKLSKSITIIIGGGGAMVLAYNFPLATSDIDGIPAKGTTVQELDPFVKEVAKELGLPGDWLNPYYSTFTHVLPTDYAFRLQTVLALKNLTVQALSKEDLLIMKCFAGRVKDKTHAKALIEKGAKLSLVEAHIEMLKKRGIPGAEKALDFLDEAKDLV